MVAIETGLTFKRAKTPPLDIKTAMSHVNLVKKAMRLDDRVS